MRSNISQHFESVVNCMHTVIKWVFITVNTEGPPAKTASKDLIRHAHTASKDLIRHVHRNEELRDGDDCCEVRPGSTYFDCLCLEAPLLLLKCLLNNPALLSTMIETL